MAEARTRLVLVLSIGLAAASACRKRLSPEDRVREVIEGAVEGAREHKVKKVVAIMSSRYADKEGRDRQALVDLVRAHILLRPNLYLVAHVSSVACEQPGQCDAQVLAAMASVPTKALSDLPKSQADIYRFDLSLVDEDGTWRVRTANWARASVKDLL
jgi:hypothetical protein